MSEQERTKRLLAMGEMAATLAHEIRNPLGSMELYCSLLKKDLKNQESLCALAEQIHSGIKNIDRIIANCLQFARDVNPRRKNVNDIRALVVQAINYAKPKADSLQVTIDFHELNQGQAYLDPHLINQVLLNLILNAVEASAEARPEKAAVLIESSFDERGNWHLVVCDNGIGISEEDKRRIFDPFFSTKQGGTGLGLTVVHSIVEAHKGRIKIESEKGKGSRFSIELPGAKCEERAEEVSSLSVSMT